MGLDTGNNIIARFASRGSPIQKGPLVSIEAMNWVLNQAPDLPPNLQPVLMGLASHAHGDGTNAYPSQDRLAFYARKKERQVRDDLKLLEEIGLIERGDQRVVAHLDPRYRPIVWNLCMWRLREIPERFLPRYARAAEGRSTPIVQKDEFELIPSEDTENRPGKRSLSDDPDIQGGSTAYPGGRSSVARGAPQRRGTIREPSKEPPSRRLVDQLPGGDPLDEGLAGLINQSRKILRCASAGLGSRTPAGSIANRLVTEVADALGRGWPPGRVETTLSASLGDATDVGRVWLTRIARDLSGAPTAAPFGESPPGEADTETANVRAESLKRRDAQIARMLERRAAAAAFGHQLPAPVAAPPEPSLPWVNAPAEEEKSSTEDVACRTDGTRKALSGDPGTRRHQMALIRARENAGQARETDEEIEMRRTAYAAALATHIDKEAIV